MRTIVLLLWFLLLTLSACRKDTKKFMLKPWPDYKKAYALLGTHPDSAFFYFNRAASHSSDKEQTVLAYYNMAMIQTDEGDYYGAQESLTLSLKALDEHQRKDWNYLATDFNELGLTSARLKQYKQALDYYDLALHYSLDTAFKPYILNNRGNVYKKLADYDKAIVNYNAVMRLTGNKPTSYARTLTNLATVKWLRDPRYNPVPELMSALAIRRRQKDTWGENSSYAQLSDFYLNSRPDSARWYAQRMLAVASRLQSPDDVLEALQKLITLSPAAEVEAYFRRYQSLTDSVETRRSAAKNQFALIRYNVEKSKAENLQLQKENTEKWYLLAAILFLVCLGSVLAMIESRKRKQRMELAAQQAVRDGQLRTSKKVHDMVANDIYRIMKKVENETDLNREWLLDNIEDVYERSRDISYELVRSPDNNFHEQLAELLLSFATETTKVVLVGNSEELWEKVDPAQKSELRYILQELMVNMRKHSQASNVIIKFAEKDGRCHIFYTDDGVGFTLGTAPKNGLTNTGNRIKGIHGEIIFDSGAGKGLQINLSFPIK